MELDFNRLDKLLRVNDPRMDNLHKDAVFKRDKNDVERLKFLRNGVDAKLEVVYDEQRWIFRPLSILEDAECTILAKNDYNSLSEHARWDGYLHIREILHRLTKALSSCPEDEKGPPITLKQLENIPSNYIIGLYNQYESLMQDLNLDIDKISNEQISFLIEEIKNNPKDVSGLTLKQAHLIILELLKVNIILTGK